MRPALLRAVGAATALYGLAVTARPGLLARPSGLVDAQGRTAEATRVSLRPTAWRDAVGGLALLCAPDGPALRTAACARVAADLGDAALLGATLPGRGRRAAAVAVSLGWGALSVAGLLTTPQVTTRQVTTREVATRQAPKGPPTSADGVRPARPGPRPG